MEKSRFWKEIDSGKLRSEPTDGDEVGQLELFAVRPESEEVDDATDRTSVEPDAGSLADGSNSSCFFCHKRLDPGAESTCLEIRSWVRGPKKDSAVLRTYTGKGAHDTCVNKLRAGIDPNHRELLESVDDPDSSEESAETIPTDRSDGYRAGHAAASSGGLAKLPPDASADFAEGFRDGNLEQAVKEFLPD